MSVHVGVGPFEMHQAWDDGEEFHSIGDGIHKEARMASPISMLMTVEQRNGSPMPFFLFIPDLIGSLCKGKTDVKPEKVSLLNEGEVCVVVICGMGSM